MHIHTRYKKGLDGMDVWHHAPIKQQPEHFKTLIHQDSLNVLDSRHHTKFRFRVSGCSEQAYSEYFFLGGGSGGVYFSCDVNIFVGFKHHYFVNSTATKAFPCCHRLRPLGVDLAKSGDSLAPAMVATACRMQRVT